MILCCGEALIDMIPNKTLDGQEAFVPHSGGAVFNTAIALGRLGRSTALLSGVSTDLFGAQLDAALGQSGVGTQYLIRSDLPTTLAFVKLENGHAKYAFYDENTAGRMIAAAALPVVQSDVGALFFGGISLACEPCADTYATLLERDGGRRAVVMDPNIRPGFAPDEQRYRARLMAMLAQADMVKVSDEDLAWILPEQDGLLSQARALQALGPAVVLVTKGAEGAIGVLPGGETVEVAAEPAEVVDTVGAGDTFNAGVMARLDEQGLLTKEALRQLAPDALKLALAHGARVAAITVARAGANPPWATEL
ncbi:carbohydrate kinase family protein [Epibacterium sp. Ofav1-8]|uniref:carbohydrate kinase family protein n=1 Tax=Epibacterium sp. Ofav1-8 TaxID=2917735 RepID=UPI001EF6B710|nr:carbohydrate kinase [Epibacterium sp. Ofav1-8]MCG7624744.1 carbohydrate kinase [Epibacterium sp. Ofav1-8]